MVRINPRAEEVGFSGCDRVYDRNILALSNHLINTMLAVSSRRTKQAPATRKGCLRYQQKELMQPAWHGSKCLQAGLPRADEHFESLQLSGRHEIILDVVASHVLIRANQIQELVFVPRRRKGKKELVCASLRIADECQSACIRQLCVAKKIA